METPIQGRPTVRCNICGKSLPDNRKSQLRHGSYCRKSMTRVKTRKKSCTACTKAKTRCDLTRPNCSRCVAKDLSCRYELPSLPSAAVFTSSTSSDQTVDVAQSSMQLVSRRRYIFTPFQDSIINSLDFVSADFLDSGRLIEPADMSTENSTAPYLNAAEMTFSNSLGYSNSVSVISELSKPTSPQSTSDKDLQYFTQTLQHDGVSLPKSFATFDSMSGLDFDQIIYKPPKAFSQRKLQNGQSSLNRSYVVCTLRSYPYMMLPNRSPPPFIHPNHGFPAKISERSIFNSGKAPLRNCANIVRWYSVKTKDSIVFIWNTIKIEQERLLAEYLHYSDSETVAALQAISVYILLRISEVNEGDSNFDFSLIDTMIKLSIKANGLIMNSNNQPGRSMTTWEDWILAESLRRTIIVLCIVDLFFDISSVMYSYKCDGSLLAGLTLPCGRDMWRASTRAEWEKEYTAQRDGKQLTYGDLMNFHLKTEGTLDPWLSQVDEFGTLVMSAASI